MPKCVVRHMNGTNKADTLITQWGDCQISLTIVIVVFFTSAYSTCFRPL